MPSLKELMSVQGRCAAITGGAGYLGRTFAETLAELGMNVAIIDLDPVRCGEVAAGLREKFGVEAVGWGINLLEEEKLLELPGRLEQAFGRLDVLINNAAFVGTSGLQGWGVKFEKQLTSTWRQAIELNLTVPFTLCRECMPMLKEHGNGSIINIGSIYGVLGPDWKFYENTDMGNPAAYGASKGGLIQFSRWLATTCAPEVRVNSICPGGIFRGQNEAFLHRYIAKTPMGRMAAEEDFKGIIAYLATDMSRYVTGQNIMIDGGFSTW